MTGSTVLLITGALLFSLGTFCLAIHRNAIRILLGIELMLNASILNFTVFSKMYGNVDGGVAAIAVMAAAAAEAAVGLALVFALFALKRHSDLEKTTELSG
ncbi:MAG: NADH-quinone oxidoreductase subunit NuoK [Candidatus Hydrogenedentota bacterium]|nr:MAG: NADH-quinone oxidoreductase subunit NuoK [Candidatus Hydrogenedentota bacterium]